MVFALMGSIDSSSDQPTNQRLTMKHKSSAVAEMGDRGHNSVGCHSST